MILHRPTNRTLADWVADAAWTNEDRLGRKGPKVASHCFWTVIDDEPQTRAQHAHYSVRSQTLSLLGKNRFLRQRVIEACRVSTHVSTSDKCTGLFKVLDENLVEYDDVALLELRYIASVPNVFLVALPRESI